MTTDESTVGDIQRAVEIVAGGKKNIILDATLLTTLMSCPRLTDFRFNHNFMAIGGKSNSLECGSLVHTFLEYFYGGIINGLTRDMAIGHAFTAAQMYIQGCPHCAGFIPTICPEHITKKYTEECPNCILKPTCKHKINEFPGLQNTPDESSDKPSRIGWKWVLETCQQYVDFWRSDHWVPLEVEVVKGKVLYEDDEIRILWKAKLDWTADTNQGIFPIDHKTMKQRRDTVSLNNQFIGQCLIMDTRNMFINKIGFQTSLKPEEKFTRTTLSYSASRLMEWQSEILPYYAKLLLMYAESGYFPPNFNNCEGKYGNCAFKSTCESDTTMREEEIKKLFIVGPEWNPTNADED